jgi:hypothetical protein
MIRWSDVASTSTVGWTKNRSLDRVAAGHCPRALVGTDLQVAGDALELGHERA